MSLLDQASLVLVPSAIKTGEVLVQKPLPNKFADETGNYDGNDPQGSANLTFTRASNATRVNSSGLVERVRTNLVLQSNTFDTTWLSNGTTETGGQAGYDGTNNAWLLQRTDGLARFVYQTTSSSGLSTFSVYAKEGNTDWLFLANGAGEYRYFDLGNGTLGATGTALFSKIESVGGGWYRCSISVANGSEVRIYPAVGNGAVSGLVGANVFIQDAMLEYGDVMTDYIPTTSAAVSVGPTSNVPRLDYSGGATCPSLLLEPQRTNSIKYSNFNASDWTQTNASVSVNSAISPDGYQNAHTATRTSSSNARIGTAVFTGTIGQPYTGSIYLRKVSGSGVVNIANINNTPTSFTLTSEWERYTVTASSASASTLRLYVDMQSDGDVIEFYEGQIELGSYPTSIIPTQASAVTRLADSASKTGISSLIGQTEGTLFVDFVYSAKSLTNRFSLSDGTVNNWIFIGTPEQGETNASRFYVRTNNTVWVDSSTSSYFIFGQRYKLALAYKSGDWAVYGNGTLLYSGTSTIQAVSSPLSEFNFVTVTAGTCQAKEEINQALLFKTRLPNSSLQELTTL